MVIAATAGYTPFHLYTRSGFAKYLELRDDLETVRARNAGLRAENARLARELEALKSDPTAIERVARQELGWVKPGEVLVDLGDTPSGRAP